MREFERITLPLAKYRINSILIGGLLAFCTVCFVIGGLATVFDSPMTALFITLLGVPYGILAVPFLLNIWIKIHLFPQGIAVTLGNKTLMQYPREKIGMFCTVEWWEKGWFRMMGISIHTPEEVTALREQQLQKGIFTRHEVKFRKRVENWQGLFRQEYLIRRARAVLLAPWKRDILWLDLNPEVQALLRQLYPEILWENLRRKGDLSHKNTEWTDKDPMAFTRTGGPDNEKDFLTMLMVVLLILLVLLVCFDGLELLILPGGSFCTLVGTMAWMCRGESDVFCLSSAGIRIMRRKQEHAVLFAGDIRTVIKCECSTMAGDYVRMAMIVSTASAEELAQRGLQWMDPSIAEAMVNIPGWERAALYRMCMQTGQKAKMKNGDCQILRWNQQREQTLRELYPQAEWIDVTVKELCNR